MNRAFNAASEAVRKVMDTSPVSLDDCAYVFAFEAINAFIKHPELSISYECREALRAALDGRNA